ncbi:uncharacterized protein [Physcomitrium patens]|uniref:Uncharacterized protein n=2 Tax=Physcomitrium patens TaxID=3218 RepID=A0A2K1KEE6_PHYPA|nr:uncharacterized protein LOC112283821 [Physcomitrium patens]PNR52157.1 hypothetical protein PHYPA_008531 [Physcomitrium patens]|eukprot:XP_024378809.1 uncharacterized protein LOC112283821 [Physcomitrella patens]
MALKVQASQTVMAGSLSLPSTPAGIRSTRFQLGDLKRPLKCRRQRVGIARASGTAEPESAGTGGPSLVDSNMMVLRKRIQSIRTQEGINDIPTDWAEWERSAYPNYRADVYLLLSTMQSQLLTLRPGTVVGIASVLMAVLPVMSILFVSALGAQLWSLHLALLELGASLHQ